MLSIFVDSETDRDGRVHDFCKTVRDSTDERGGMFPRELTLVARRLHTAGRINMRCYTSGLSLKANPSALLSSTAVADAAAVLVASKIASSECDEADHTTLTPANDAFRNVAALFDAIIFFLISFLSRVGKIGRFGTVTKP